MVEGMDHTQDVERLFSWLKAPMVHYREFAPQAVVAAAVAAWPVVHRAAIETGIAGEDSPAPHGGEAAREHVARERMAMPPAAAQALRETPLMSPSIAAQPEAASDVAAPSPAEPPAAPRAEPGSAAPLPEPRRAADRATDAAVEPPPVRPQPEAAQPPRPPYRAPERGALFGGEYRGREHDPRPAGPVADRHDRTLDAVFSRLAGGRDKLPDPRTRARTSPGLGGVFGRLR